MIVIRERTGDARAGGRGTRARAAVRRASLAILAVVIAAGAAAAQVRATYRYHLSDFGGSIPFDFVRLHADPETNEVYVIHRNLVRVFNPSGMEVFSFGEDLDVGQLLDVVVEGNGDIILLSFKEGRTLITRCSFRGAPVATLTITGLPAGTLFAPNRMIARKGALYFASMTKSLVTITDTNGKFREQIDFLSMVSADEKQKDGAEMAGFAVDVDGAIYFSIPVYFKVYKYSADKTLASFGKPGSAAGKFGILGGIALDSRGNILVTDRLKCTVMAFDRAFSFLAQFGYRGPRPQNLIIPEELAIDGRDLLYVSQAGRRGVSVFSLNHN